MSFKLNLKGIKQLDKGMQQCLEMTGEALLGNVISAQVIPFDEGDMQNKATFVDYSQSSKGLVEIVTNSPQARRLYFHPEYDFQTINNPNAKGEWYKDWLKGGSKFDFAQNTFSKFLRRKL